MVPLVYRTIVFSRGDSSSSIASSRGGFVVGFSLKGGVAHDLTKPLAIAITSLRLGVILKLVSAITSL